MPDKVLHVRVSDKLYATILKVCDTRGLLLSEACRDALRKEYPYEPPKNTPTDTPDETRRIPFNETPKNTPKVTPSKTPTDTPKVEHDETDTCQICGKVFDDMKAFGKHITKRQHDDKHPRRAKQYLKAYGEFFIT
jgi:uncharacterized C2H2 Zn-finger protein